MLATELTESLRRHLLWERQENRRTANAVFKRKRTDVYVMKGDIGATVYGAVSGCIAKMSRGQEGAAREHQELRKSAETTIDGYDLW